MGSVAAQSLRRLKKPGIGIGNTVTAVIANPRIKRGEFAAGRDLVNPGAFSKWSGVSCRIRFAEDSFCIPFSNDGQNLCT